MDAERNRRKEWASSEVREIRKNQTVKEKAKDSSFDKGTETLNDTYVCVWLVGGENKKKTKRKYDVQIILIIELISFVKFWTH